MADLYEELGLSRDASEAEIKAAKRAAARAHHPDKGGDPETFKRKMRAVAILGDPDSRAHYDRTGDEGDGQSKLDNPIRSLILAAFESGLQSAADALEYVDIAAYVRSWLVDKARDGEEHIEGARDSMRKLRAIQERFSFSGEGEDFIGEAIRAKLRNAEQSIARNEELVGHYRAAKGYAEAWTYRKDERPRPPRDIRFEDLMAANVRATIEDVLRGMK